jgi:hypothetical protein
MEIDTFRRILTAFADSPADIDLSRGRVLVQIREELIEATLSDKAGELFVEENGTRTKCVPWIVNRIARLPLLADRIISYVPEVPHFVAPSGTVWDQPDYATGESEGPVPDAISAIQTLLERRPAWTTSVTYLTSDAGEGKTSLISHLARAQAQAFKSKTTDWLLVPISLGGRSFLRFDDVVIAALANRLRFQMFYFDGFLELVKLGVVVPAFDGFEEMFVESSSGEALSALGNLGRALTSRGTILVAARKAYFEYESFSTQARLFDGMGGESVSFSRIGLARWTKAQFERYASLRKVPEPLALYQKVAARFGAEHPLLTRAVLVRRLVDVAAGAAAVDDLVATLGSSPQDYFFQFVNAIIVREANEKWIDRSGEPFQQLLSVPEHHHLLAMVASEMWISSTDTLKGDVLDIVADLFADSFKKSPLISRQVKERLRHHSLLVASDSARNGLSFDHEDFRKFFLGEALGAMMRRPEARELRPFLRVAALPAETGEAAIHHLHRANATADQTLVVLQELASSEVSTSFVRENVGLLCINLLDIAQNRPLELRGMSFPPDALKGRKISEVRFIECYFQPTSLENATISDSEFVNCTFDRIEFGKSTVVHQTLIRDCEISSVVNRTQDDHLFDPRGIVAALELTGFSFPSVTSVALAPTLDEQTRVLERSLRIFLRSSHVNEDHFRHRLGAKSSLFIEDVLPGLLKVGVLEEITYLGKGNQRRFRLVVPMQSIQAALQGSGGQFANFLQHFE